MNSVDSHGGMPSLRTLCKDLFRSSMTKSCYHIFFILAITMSTAALYNKVATSYFCSDDDFLEVYRAAFEDIHNPAVMFTTPHFRSFKYRPLNRALNLLTYVVGNGRASAFRIRNLSFHLLNVTLVYVIAVLLRKPIPVAATASLLFAVSPLANQSVIGAVMTNTAAHFMYLLALILFILSTRTANRQILYVFLAGLVAAASLFCYDNEIVVYGAMATYLFILHFVLRQHFNKSITIVFSIMTACSLTIYFGARQMFVASGYHAAATSIPNLHVAIRNGVIYVAALLQVLDPVLLNQLFATPLPSDATFVSGLHGIAFIVGTAFCAIAISATIYFLAKASRPLETWAIDSFLLVAGLLPLLPILVLASHPSETYLYLTVALAMIVMMSLLYDLCWTGFRRPWIFVTLTSCLALVFGAATWVRNQRVAACGATSQKILAAISHDGLRSGASLAFADAPGENSSKPYGYYRFTGLGTIASMNSMRSRSLQCAVRLVTGRPDLSVEMLDSEGLNRIENGALAPYDMLILVHSDGTIVQQKIVR